MKRVAIAAGLAAMMAGPAMAANPGAIDWSKVPTVTKTLFWPGQSTYQWLRSDEHKKANQKVKEGRACVLCHEGEEEMLGEKLVKENQLEPMPVEGKNGFIKLGVQIAYDTEAAYFRFQWKTRNPWPGEAHPYLRYDGHEWHQYGYPKLDAVVQDGEQPGIYEDRMTIFIDDGSVPLFDKQGCWLTCHDGMRDSPNLPTKDEVTATEFFKRIKKSDVRKYLPLTRTDPNASWDKGKSAEEIADLKAKGMFIDTMQWRGHRSNPVGMADDGYVLEYRNSDAGKNPFGSNVDRAKHQPKFMYDEKKFGKKAIREEDIRKGPSALIREENAAPFDPNAGWKEGDMIPEYVVSRADSKGSAADNSYAKGVWKDGMWTVVMVRKMGLANPDDKALKVGGVYTIGLGTHDDNITTRGHFVSFPFSVGFGAPADIEATKLN